jgi:hypothetical protein
MSILAIIYKMAFLNTERAYLLVKVPILIPPTHHVDYAKMQLIIISTIHKSMTGRISPGFIKLDENIPVYVYTLPYHKAKG